MHRFYLPDADFTNQTVSITNKNEIHHLHDVLRLKKDDEISIFDGRGSQATGRISACLPLEVQIEIIKVEKITSSMPRIILACAIPKKTKFEWIIEKATELGVSEIIPLKTKRTEIDLKGDRLEKKIQRYQTVAVNAAKQSKRVTVPLIHTITAFDAALSVLTQNATVIIPSLSGKREPLLTVLLKIKPSTPIAFLIGPEGDFTKEEYGQARARGCHAVTLGETTLKVETAAIATLACAQIFYSHKEN